VDDRDRSAVEELSNRNPSPWARKPIQAIFGWLAGDWPSRLLCPTPLDLYRPLLPMFLLTGVAAYLFVAAPPLRRLIFGHAGIVLGFQTDSSPHHGSVPAASSRRESPRRNHLASRNSSGAVAVDISNDGSKALRAGYREVLSKIALRTGCFSHSSFLALCVSFLRALSSLASVKTFFPPPTPGQIKFRTCARRRRRGLKRPPRCATRVPSGSIRSQIPAQEIASCD